MTQPAWETTVTLQDNGNYFRSTEVSDEFPPHAYPITLDQPREDLSGKPQKYLWKTHEWVDASDDASIDIREQLEQSIGALGDSTNTSIAEVRTSVADLTDLVLGGAE